MEVLRELLLSLEAGEEERLSPLAVKSREAVRRRPERYPDDHRQAFARDADRILHTKAYSRYIDKTQVFSLVDNDHITHRVLHVQLVSRIGRTIGRFLGLNEDLIEAIALGHDLGHPPFGHEGERILSRLCRSQGLPSFQHNIQSVQFLEHFEKKGKGVNLSLQVLDGILCHDGESHAAHLQPDRQRDFQGLDREMAAKAAEPLRRLIPMSLEGCVVRLADTIGYIGRDIEDAIALGLIRREEIPETCRRVLGASNGTIVYNLVTDCICHSHHVQTAGSAQRGGAGDRVGLSDERAAALLELKRFNYERIYHNPVLKPDYNKITNCYEQLFAYCLKQVEQGDARGEVGRWLGEMEPSYSQSHAPAAMVRDFIAGMTDDYFLRQAGSIGCALPGRLCVTN